MKTIYLTYFGLLFTISVMGQTKKSQIQTLAYQVDSLEQLIVNERSNNSMKVGILESEISILKVRLNDEQEELSRISKELGQVKSDLKLENENFLIQKKELDKINKQYKDLYTELTEAEYRYDKLESIFTYTLFKKEIEKIENDNYGYAEVRKIYFGDLTGDGIEEIIFYYVLLSNDGGNTSSGTGLVIYKIEKEDLRVYGTYHNHRLFIFDKVLNGIIFIDFLEYAEGDATCCHSIKVNSKIEFERR